MRKEGRKNSKQKFIHGHNSWSKGLTKETDIRVAKNVESRTIPRETRICGCGCRGIFVCKENSEQRFIDGHNRILPRETRYCKCDCGETFECLAISKQRFIDGHQSRHLSQEARSKISLSLGGTGIPYENSEYPPDFNQQLKDRIRVRDKFICQKCGIPELECDRRLSIHHIDYNKKNCREDNLTSLCTSCNVVVNANREYWTNYFTQNMLNKL